MMLLVFQLNCSRVRSFLRHRLGRYITNVTHAAELCSDFLCQRNGRCVRRDPLAHHYLHLSARSHRIRPAPDGGFAVSGDPSPQELRLLARRFRCHCYEGHDGERCDRTHTAREDEDDGDEDDGDEDGDEDEGRRTREEEHGEGGGARVAGLRLDLLVTALLMTTVVRW